MKIKTTTTIFLILLILVLFLSFIRTPICKGQIFSFARPWVLIFWPPSDLFEPLLVEDIDLFNIKQAQKYQFKIKYTGLHSISVLFDKFEKKLYNKTYETNLKLKFVFYDDKGKYLLTKFSDSLYRPFYGKTGDGFEFSKINVPIEIPNGKAIKFKIEVIQIDKQINKYGNSMIFIQKCSEK